MQGICLVDKSKHFFFSDALDMPERTCSAAVTMSPVYSYDGNRWPAQPCVSCDALQGMNMALIA